MDDMTETLDCYAAMRRLWEYLDGELSDRTLRAVHSHLSVCAECYQHFDFARQFLAALEAARAEECAPPRLRSQVLEALRVEGFTPRYGEC